MSFRTPLFNEGVKNNILRDIEGEILRGLFLLEKWGETLKTAGLSPIKFRVIWVENETQEMVFRKSTIKRFAQ